MAVTCALVILAGCGGADGGAPAEPTLISRTMVLQSPNEKAFLKGVLQREPKRATRIKRVDLVEFGIEACRLTDGYVHGTSPNPGDLLQQVMIDRGYPEPLSETMTTDIRNAMLGTLCKYDVVTGP